MSIIQMLLYLLNSPVTVCVYANIANIYYTCIVETRFSIVTIYIIVYGVKITLTLYGQ
jgi:hypothetical protein